MGIVNVTPDSFSDGGRFLDPEKALGHGMDLVAQGADILDVGAESTRPGASPVDADEELRRLIPLITSLAKRVPIPISVDTMKARVAQAAIDAGASIVNDVTALRFDPEMASVIARTGAGAVLMHMQGMPETMQQAPQYEDVVSEVCEFFAARVDAAEQAGIAKSHIVLDPGIGFGKLQDHNVQLLNRLSAFRGLNRPILVGVSRKAFLGKILDRPVEDRIWGTAAAVALAVDRGADILRVHDVAEMLDVVKVAAAMKAVAVSLKREGYA
ncbi:dihydropteroate synthase [Nitrospira sp. NS4]|uniref:dihydropteroate synthase n=1 Tax=Nitrospira sp. NS4 TaxID=3414498 RepID=UPI003C30E1DA